MAGARGVDVDVDVGMGVGVWTRSVGGMGRRHRSGGVGKDKFALMG